MRNVLRAENEKTFSIVNGTKWIKIINSIRIAKVAVNGWNTKILGLMQIQVKIQRIVLIVIVMESLQNPISRYSKQ